MITIGKHLSHIFFCAIVLFLLAGCLNASPQNIAPQPTPFLTSAAPANPTPSPTLPQKLRIINQSAIAIHNLHVRFPNESVEFGDVLPGVTTAYQLAAHGVYSYAAYDVDVQGQNYQQPVIDWMGEYPMDGSSFTYVLDVDPAQWTTHGQVILLVRVNRDAPQP